MRKRWAIAAVSVAAILLIVIAVILATDKAPAQIAMGDKTFHAEVAATEQQREQGLSGREHLAEDAALVFVFDAANTYCFWMKDMKFDIDMIWLDANKRIIHQQRNATPDSYPQNFCPEQDAKYVVEVVAGTAEKLGLQQGDYVTFSNL